MFQQRKAAFEANSTAIGGYGIVVDGHRPRQDGGVPVYWDGWYAEERYAIAALALARQKFPHAHIYLVAQLTGQHRCPDGRRLVVEECPGRGGTIK
jgi:hypothetical protein